jgi:uncharacterized OB-fold protein/acyl dehydratase
MGRESRELEAELKRFVGLQEGPAQVAADPVNEPMIRHWCQAMGDRNPAYLDPVAAEKSVHGGLVAPPTMLQAWILPGFEMSASSAEPRNKQQELHALLSERGYTGVVATNCQQHYDRYLRPGDRVSATTVIESISEEKATALGTGYFIETRTAFEDQGGERVGWMVFRVLKFKPAQPPPAAAAPESGAAPRPTRLRPLRAHDNGWWWEGIERGELLIQKCAACGELRHPPRPMCGHCQSLEWESVPSSGRGTVYSYVVLHHPPIPGYEFPLPVALIELEEGTRIVSNVMGCEPGAVRIGMSVECRIESVDDELKLPLFYPVD